ncbi:hypothetical protein KAT51_08670 [bacterium]|nr:hypothetical protein [bacterium]
MSLLFLSAIYPLLNNFFNLPIPSLNITPSFNSILPHFGHSAQFSIVLPIPSSPTKPVNSASPPQDLHSRNKFFLLLAFFGGPTLVIPIIILLFCIFVLSTFALLF